MLDEDSVGVVPTLCLACEPALIVRTEATVGEGKTFGEGKARET